MSRNLPDRISSTKVRELVMAGQMEEAHKMLGRHYQIRGVVVTGRDRGGKLLGIPTANINLSKLDKNPLRLALKSLPKRVLLIFCKSNY